VLGGLKTKDVDVVITKDGIGPCLAVSVKGALGAFRNLTNRMEEAVGDCTNLHITYPALVYGFLIVLRANRSMAVVGEGAQAVEGLEHVAPAAADTAIRKGGEPAETIVRFHSALRELTGRRGIRDDVSRYEAIALGLADTAQTGVGSLLATFPPEGSPLRFEHFFERLYVRYDERFVYGAPDLKSVTRRLEWSPESPALHLNGRRGSGDVPVLDYEPRQGAQ
jgi:hypothetical protein